jgi:predicted AlkP superfamily pyrophosphatase or phosphodiesterase
MLPAGHAFLTLALALLRLFALWRQLLVVALVIGPALMLDALIQPTPPTADDGRPQLVVLIGIDGLTSRAFGLGNTAVMEKLAQDGAHTLKMQAVLPTMSSPNWASHLLGAGPRRHGIRDNAWRRDKWDAVALCGRPVGAGWPSIFELIQIQRPAAWTAVVHDWIGIGRLVPRAHVDRRRFRPTEAMATRTALRQLDRRNPPLLTFLHLDHVDKAGHSYGFDSWQYHKAVADADAIVGQILERLERQGLTEDALIAIVSDHGGRGRGHGGDSLEETSVPWILWGRGVQAGLDVQGDLTVRDTAPTLAYALGLQVPDCWTGNAVTQAFAFAPREPSPR